MRSMQMGQDGCDAMGKMKTTRDEIAGDNHHIRLQFVHPADKLDEVSLPHHGAVMQIRDLHDAESLHRRIEIHHRHAPAMDIHPAPVHGQEMHAREPDARQAVPDGMTPAMLAAPFRKLEIISKGLNHVYCPHISRAEAISPCACASPFLIAAAIPSRYADRAAATSPRISWINPV